MPALRSVRLLVAAVTAGAVTGCSIMIDRAAPLPAARDHVAYSPAYLVNPGDHLRIHHPHDPDFDEQIVVRPDGWINLALAGEIHAADRSPEAVASDIAERMRAVTTQPELSVDVSLPLGAVVSVGGAVAEPQRVSLARAATVLDAVLASGGLQYFGDADRVVLLRRTPDGSTTAMRLALANDGPSDGDIPLVARDVLFVPKTRVGTAVETFEQVMKAILPDRRTFTVYYAINTPPVPTFR